MREVIHQLRVGQGSAKSIKTRSSPQYGGSLVYSLRLLILCKLVGGNLERCVVVKCEGEQITRNTGQLLKRFCGQQPPEQHPRARKVCCWITAPVFLTSVYHFPALTNSHNTTLCSANCLPSLEGLASLLSARILERIQNLLYAFNLFVFFSQIYGVLCLKFAVTHWPPSYNALWDDRCSEAAVTWKIFHAPNYFT